MFKAIIVAAILAIATAVPEPKTKPGLAAAAYSAPVLAASAPLSYSAYSAYSAPVAYSGYYSPYTAGYAGYSAYSPYYF